ncbi:MAG: MBL fold metallo-hydrolase, partial [Solirubrobacteraceae bacterium]|nr:MBL fold metallo-hydrolase [Solirubrobacteraceae bacterium]
SMLAIATESSMSLSIALGSRPPIDVPLSEGDVIRAGGRDLTVLHRPGHSLSDIVLVDRADGTAIVGDHLLAGMSPNPILAPPHEVKFPDARTERVRSLLLYLDSVRKTAEDGLQLVLPGHGPSIGPPADLITERLAFHERRAQKIAGMLGDEPRTVFELASRLWKDVPIRQPQLTHSEVIGHLDLLAERGETTDVPLEDGIVGFIAT